MKEVRPTTGKVLQAVFSILGDLEGKGFLDLFSGTGRISLAAWERGATPVVAVEALRDRAREIKNIVPSGAEDSFIVLSLDVRRCFSWLLRRNYRFDVIFADPPYESGLVAETLSLVGKNSAICSTDCLLIIERSVREPIVEVPPEGFVLSDERTYGESAVSFFRLRGNAS